MKKDPDCLACDKFGPPRWDPVEMEFNHQIPYGPHYTIKALQCPASVIDGRWQHGKREDR